MKMISSTIYVKLQGDWAKYFEIPHHVMAQWKLKKFDDFD